MAYIYIYIYIYNPMFNELVYQKVYFLICFLCIKWCSKIRIFIRKDKGRYVIGKMFLGDISTTHQR